MHLGCCLPWGWVASCLAEVYLLYMLFLWDWYRERYMALIPYGEKKKQTTPSNYFPKSSYENCYLWDWASGRDHLNSYTLTHFSNNSCSKNSAGRPFLPWLGAFVSCRLIGGEPTALISHISIQDRRLQGTYCLHNLNECIARIRRSCSLLVGYAEERSLLYLCIFR